MVLIKRLIEIPNVNTEPEISTKNSQEAEYCSLHTGLALHSY